MSFLFVYEMNEVALPDPPMLKPPVLAPHKADPQRTKLPLPPAVVIVTPVASPSSTCLLALLAPPTCPTLAIIIVAPVPILALLAPEPVCATIDKDVVGNLEDIIKKGLLLGLVVCHVRVLGIRLFATWATAS